LVVRLTLVQREVVVGPVLENLTRLATDRAVAIFDMVDSPISSSQALSPSPPN
jgi:hypothetical protein